MLRTLELGEGQLGATEGSGGESIGASWYGVSKPVSQERPAGGSNMVGLALSAVLSIAASSGGVRG